MPKKISPAVTGSSDLTSQSTTIKGTNNPIHGNVFHLKLSMLFLIRGIKAGHRFRLGTEQEEIGGKFDDLVFMYMKRGEEKYRYRFFQAKHRLDDNQKIKLGHLLRDDGSNFSLPKYFRSYLENIVNGPQGLRQEEIDDLVICTNIGVHDSLKNYTIEYNEHQSTNTDEILGFEFRSGKKLTKRLKLKPELLRNSLKERVEPIYLLAKELLDCAKRNKNMDLKNDILKRYHVTLVNEKVIDIKTKKFHQDFVEGLETNLSADALRLRNTMITMLEKSASLESELKIGKNFGTSTGNGGFDKLPDYVVSDQDVENFLEKFVLAVEAPNEEELTEILHSEIRSYSKFDLLEQDFQNAYFFHRMMDWFKKKKDNEKDSWMSSDEGRAVLENMDQKIENIRIDGISRDFRKTILGFLGFNDQTINEMKQTLENCLSHKSDNSVVTITTPSPKLTANKVISAIDTISAYQAEDSYLVTSLRKLREESERWESAFLAKDSHNLLIIVCEDKGDELNSFDYPNFFAKRNSNMEKTILIIRRKHNKDETSSVQEDFPLYDQLNHVSKRKILSRKVFFQGVEMEVKDLTGTVEFHKGMLDLDSIVELLDEENSIVIPSFDIIGKFVNSFYIERTLTYHSHFDNKFWSKVAEKLKCTLEQLKTECQTDEKGRFKWLIRDYVRMSEIWKKIKEVLSSNEFKDSSYYETIEESDLIVDETNPKKVVVISGVPGSGKSSILSQYYQIIKKQSPYHWVIRINLASHYDAFSKFNHQCEIVQFFVEHFPSLTTANSSFFLSLLKQRLEYTGNITFLFDGFDEITNEAQNKTIELFKALRTTKVERLCITTRSHMIGILENVFCQFGYCLENFSQQDQTKFLVHYWSKNEKDEVKKAYIRKFAETQIEQIAKNLRDEERSFVGVPLQCRILAECFERQLKGMDNLLIEHEPTVDINLNLAGLYRLLMETKFAIYVEEKIVTNNTTKSFITTTIKEKTETFLRKLAFELIVQNKEDVDIFLGLSPFFQSKEDSLQRDLNNAEFGISVGVLQKDFEGEIQFLHRTYAEYLVADFIYQGFHLDDAKHNGLLDATPARNVIFNKIFLEDAYEGVMTFLNCMIKSLLDNPKWQDAVESHTTYNLPDRFKRVIKSICINFETLRYPHGCFIAHERKFAHIFRFICDCLEARNKDPQHIRMVLGSECLKEITPSFFRPEYKHFADTYKKWLSFYEGANHEDLKHILGAMSSSLKNLDRNLMGISLWTDYWNNEKTKRNVELTLDLMRRERVQLCPGSKALLHFSSTLLGFFIHNDYYDSILPLLLDYLSFQFPEDKDFMAFFGVFFGHYTIKEYWTPNRTDFVLGQLATILQSDSIKRLNIIKGIRREVLVMGSEHFLRLYKTPVAKIGAKLLSIAAKDARTIFERDEHQMTILHRAAFSGDSKAIGQLFATQNLQVLRAIIIVLCQGEYSPFFIAASKCNEEICCKFLLFLNQDFATQTSRTTVSNMVKCVLEESLGIAFVRKRTDMVRVILTSVRDALGLDILESVLNLNVSHYVEARYCEGPFQFRRGIITVYLACSTRGMTDTLMDVVINHNQSAAGEKSFSYALFNRMLLQNQYTILALEDVDEKTLQKLISVMGFEQWIRFVLSVELFVGFYQIICNLEKLSKEQHLQFVTIITSSLNWRTRFISYWETLFTCYIYSEFYLCIDTFFKHILKSLGKEILKEKLLFHDDGKTVGRMILNSDWRCMAAVLSHLPKDISDEFYMRLIENLPHILKDPRILLNSFSESWIRDMISILVKYADKDQWDNFVKIILTHPCPRSGTPCWQACLVRRTLPGHELEKFLVFLTKKLGPIVIEQLVLPYMLQLLYESYSLIDTMLELLFTYVPNYNRKQITDYLLEAKDSKTITNIFALLLKYSDDAQYLNKFFDNILSNKNILGGKWSPWSAYIEHHDPSTTSIKNTSSFLLSVKKYDANYLEKLLFHDDGKVIASILFRGDDALFKVFFKHLMPFGLQKVAQYGMQHLCYKYANETQQQQTSIKVNSCFFSFLVDYGDKQQVINFIKNTIKSSLWIEWMRNVTYKFDTGKSFDDVKCFWHFLTENVHQDDIKNWVYSNIEDLVKLMFHAEDQLSIVMLSHLSDKSYDDLGHDILDSMLNFMKTIDWVQFNRTVKHSYWTNVSKTFEKYASRQQLLQFIDILLSVQENKKFPGNLSTDVDDIPFVFSLWSDYVYQADDNEMYDRVNELLKCAYDTFGSQKVKELVLHSPLARNSSSVIIRAVLDGEHEMVKAMLKHLSKKDREEAEHFIQSVQ